MNFIPLASPDIQEIDIQAVSDVLKTGMLVQGIHVNELESKFSAVVGSQHASAVSNGTATIHLALLALGIGKGDEVIVPAFSYIATANVVELVGATPIFVDIDINTFNIDDKAIEKAITSKTKAIIPVHEFGLACNIEEVVTIAKINNLYVIEDAACAMGATVNNKHVGTFGNFGSFSLHPRKAVSSGEGGLLLSSDAELDKQIKILRNHGIDMQDGKMEFVAAGFNYRMTDFQAALVKSQLNRLETILEKKEKLAQLYFQHITNPKVILPTVPQGKKHTWQTFHVLVDENTNRDELINSLKAKNIGTNYGAQCIPTQKYYQKKYQLDCPALYPNAMKAYTKGLAIPLYEKLNDEMILYISSELNKL